MPKIHIYRAAVKIGMSPRLLRWFVSYAPKKGETRKLQGVLDQDDVHWFEEDELDAWDQYLRDEWPDDQRDIPDGIRREIELESGLACGMCRTADYFGDVEHIDDWAQHHSHHPHGLIYICARCHKAVKYRNDLKKTFRQRKAELLNRSASV